MAEHKAEIAVNSHCPWSGKPVSADSLVKYKGFTVGFCNPGCAGKFAQAVEALDAAISLASRETP